MTLAVPQVPDPLATISIGLPVFNGESTLRNALESLLSQTFKNFEIIVSDNASTDKTQAICEEFVKKDNRITYVRQTTNMGAFSNFIFVLSRARTDFFMWAAHDDSWSPRFIETNLSLLTQNPLAVSAISKVAFTDGVLSNATNPLKGNKGTRLRNYIQDPGDNSRLYGIHRTSALQGASSSQNCNSWAGDWTLMLEMVIRGEFLEVNEILMERAAAPAGKYYDNLTGTFFDRYFPLVRYSKSVLRVPENRTVAVIRILTRQNLIHHLAMAKRFGWFTHRLASSNVLKIPNTALKKLLADR